MNHVDEIAEVKGIGAKEVYTLREVQLITGWHKRLIYGAVNEGKLNACYPREGMTRNRYVKSDELQRWIDSL